MSESYDCIVLRHFLEHLSDPKGALALLNQHMKKGGIFVVVVPNINCLGRYLFETDWNWVLPYHCNFFSVKSIAALLEKSGCEILECYQTPSPLYFAESLIKKTKSQKVKRILKYSPILESLFSATLSIFGTSIGLGDNITVIARKNA